MRRLEEAKVQELVNTGWAFSIVGKLDVPLSAMLARLVELRVGDLDT